MNSIGQKPNITVEQLSSLNDEQLAALKEFNLNVPSVSEFTNKLDTFTFKPIEKKAGFYWGKIYKRIASHYFDPYNQLLLKLKDSNLKNSAFISIVENLVQDLNSIKDETDKISLQRISLTADKVHELILTYEEWSKNSLSKTSILFNLKTDLNEFILCCKNIEACEKCEEGLQALEVTKPLFPFAKAFKFIGWVFSSEKIKAFEMMEILYHEFKKKEDLKKEFVNFTHELGESTEYLRIKEFIKNWNEQFRLSFSESPEKMAERLKSFEQIT